MWVQLAILVISLVISYATRPKPKNAKPPTIGDFTVPTAEDGREIPVLFGTRDFLGPNIVWYGDLRVVPIKKKA